MKLSFLWFASLSLTALADTATCGADSGGNCSAPLDEERNETDYVSNNSNNTISDGVVHELGLDNFYSVIGESSYTVVLFYDPLVNHNDSSTVPQKQAILQRLAADFSKMAQPKSFMTKNLRIHFAQLDVRQHNFLRRIYVRWQRRGSSEGSRYRDYFQDYRDLDEPNSPIPDTMVNSTTFMRLNQLPTMRSEWALMQGSNFDIANCIDESEEIDGKVVDPLDYDIVRQWFVQEIQDDLIFNMQGTHQPPLAFGESNKGPRAAIKTYINREKNYRENYVKTHPMDSIDWDMVKNLTAAAGHDKNAEVASTFNKESYQVQYDDQGDAFWKYELTQNVKINNARALQEITDLIDFYLARANSYENLWSPERKAAEDARTNYGALLQQMDAKLKEVLFSTYQDLTNDFSLISQDMIPKLEDFYGEMLFGYGRSPTTLEKYLREHLPWDGSRAKDLEKGLADLPLFERIREYMKVREVVGEREPYSVFLRTLWIQFHAIVSEFQSNLTRNWLAYLEVHPEEKMHRYDGFQAIDKFDMGDSAHAKLLANYDLFQSMYVSQRKPFVLTNVNMTKDKYTLDHLVKKCGFVDVSDGVKQSKRLGDKSVKGWGGLSTWELPQEVMTEARLRSEDNDGNKEWDTKLSLEQFVELIKYMDDIYLHDFSLKSVCSSLFWAETPYDPPSQQYFRIPGVIGRFDLFQKLPRSRYADSWPSLFIGRKGSNSKLHIDSAATGFWMYLVSGRKRWIIYDEAERPYLYERMERTAFIADVLSLNATQDVEDRTMIHDYFDATYPLLSRANAGNGAYEIIQEANQLLYIPPNSPHAVENLEDIVGISFNQVPKSGIVNHLFQMIHGRRAFGTVELALRYFLSDPEKAFAVLEKNPDDPLFVNFGEYVAQ